MSQAAGSSCPHHPSCTHTLVKGVDSCPPGPVKHGDRRLFYQPSPTLSNVQGTKGPRDQGGESGTHSPRPTLWSRTQTRVPLASLCPFTGERPSHPPTLAGQPEGLPPLAVAGGCSPVTSGPTGSLRPSKVWARGPGRTGTRVPSWEGQAEREPTLAFFLRRR